MEKKQRYDTLNIFLNQIEKEIEARGLSYLNIGQMIIALKVLEDRLWNFDDYAAQRCNDIMHKLID